MRNIFKIELHPERVFGLDILRALAILFVLIDHSGQFLPENLKKISYVLRFDGVSIFFVLSGFLIGGILIKLLEKNNTCWSLLFGFWKRRWFRTLPNYFLILILLATLEFIFRHEAYLSYDIYRYFLFLQNFFQPHPWFFAEAWSLSIEEWFYLTIPVLVIAGIRVFRFSVQKSILFSALLVIAAVLSFRIYRYIHMPFTDIISWDLNFRKQVSTRLDGIMFGVLGAYLQFYHFKRWIKNKKQLLIAGIIILFGSRILFRVIAVDSLYSCVFSFVTISIGTLLLIPYLSEVKTAKDFLYKILTYISLISYSMYLLNLSVIKEWIIDNIPWDNLPLDSLLTAFLKYSLFWLLVVLMSILLYKYFEVPMTKLRDKK